LGRLDEAIERQRRALQIDPGFGPAEKHLGQALFDTGRYDDALAAFGKAVDLDPRDASAHNGVGAVLAALGRTEQAIESFHKALEVEPGKASTHSNLAAALVSAGRDDEAMEHLLQALQLDPNYATAHVRMANVLVRRGQHDEAIRHYRQALRTEPKDGLTYLSLGMALEGRGELGEAIEHYRQAVELRAKDPRAVTKLAALLVAQGDTDEARTIWRTALDANPPAHEAWHGYAELCLYLGDEAEYRRARTDVLTRFGDTADPLIAGRTARACLLLPPAEDELRKVAALAERAAAARGQDGDWAPFVKGMLAFRQGRLDAAIESSQGDAPGVSGPAPSLVLAMALHRAGRTDQAMKALAGAALMFDWRPAAARGRDAWVFHALRREAESLVLPNRAAFLEGAYQPSRNDERLALLPACQFNSRPRAAAGLFADAFGADSAVADDLATGCRYNAACAAALAGSGVGDGITLDEGERWRLRGQARQWLRADLAAWAKAIDGGDREGRQRMRREVRRQLTHWQTDPDLTALREPKSLAGFSRAEQTDCFALWDEVAGVLRRAMAE
jgi:serine/threonine-protein kinase